MQEWSKNFDSIFRISLTKSQDSAVGGGWVESLCSRGTGAYNFEIKREEQSHRRKGKKGQKVLELPQLPSDLRHDIANLNIDDRTTEVFDDVTDGTCRNRRPIYELKTQRYFKNSLSNWKISLFSKGVNRWMRWWNYVSRSKRTLAHKVAKG